MVQNTHYGGRDMLPFDLKHKAGPIQFHLGPESEKPEIEKARKALARNFVEALRPYIQEAMAVRSKDGFTQIHEQLSTLRRAQSFPKTLLLQITAILTVTILIVLIVLILQRTPDLTGLLKAINSK
jgi:hypothetical protein